MHERKNSAGRLVRRMNSITINLDKCHSMLADNHWKVTNIVQYFHVFPYISYIMLSCSCILPECLGHRSMLWCVLSSKRKLWPFIISLSLWWWQEEEAEEEGFELGWSAYPGLLACRWSRLGRHGHINFPATTTCGLEGCTWKYLYSMYSQVVKHEK